MHVKFTELYNTAYTEIVNNTASFLVTKDMVIERFAELVIRECRDIVGKTKDQAIEGGWNVDEAMSTAMFEVEERFGVKL